VTITCKRCAKDKHPGLFRPTDVKRGTNVCRECRLKEAAYLRPANSTQGDYWRTSNANLFTSDFKIGEPDSARYAAMRRVSSEPGVKALRKGGDR
jgi:hypothetical protein